MISGPLSTSTARERVAGYRRALGDSIPTPTMSWVSRPTSATQPLAARSTRFLLSTAGGEPEDIADAREVLEALAGRLVVCGGPGTGQVAKACNQLVVTANLVAVAEALVLAASLGADPARVREALLGGYAASRVLELQGDRMLRRDFSLGGSVRNHVKDIGIVRSLGAGQGTEVFEAAARALEHLAEEGGGDLDHSAVVRVVEGRIGRELPPSDRS